MTNLDKLNSLLRNPKLGIPDFRAQVDKSGSNLTWLKKNLPKNCNANAELLKLVSLDIKSLLQDYQVVETSDAYGG